MTFAALNGKMSLDTMVMHRVIKAKILSQGHKKKDTPKGHQISTCGGYWYLCSLV